MQAEEALMTLLGGLGQLPETQLEAILDSFTWEAADYVFDGLGEELDGLIDLRDVDAAGQG